MNRISAHQGAKKMRPSYKEGSWDRKHALLFRAGRVIAPVVPVSPVAVIAPVVPVFPIGYWAHFLLDLLADRLKNLVFHFFVLSLKIIAKP